MNETGRIVDVKVEDVYFFKGDPDKEKLAGYVMVWADAGMKDVIAGVEGVEVCYKDIGETRYHAYLDPRYDRGVVKFNIKVAVIGATINEPVASDPLHATKVGVLIGQIAHEAEFHGFHEGLLYNFPTNEAVAKHIQCASNAAQNRCREAQAELSRLLGIKMG